MKDFRQLVIWQKAHQLTLEIYQFTKLFPREETYGLTAQIRRTIDSNELSRRLRTRGGQPNSLVFA